MVERWTSVVGAFGLALCLLGIAALIDSRQQRDLGAEFLATGVRVVAEDVVIEVGTGKGGDYLDAVDVTYTVAGQRRQDELVDSLGDVEGNELGRHAPNPGTRYAAPLQLLVRPGEADPVMALVDAQEFADSPHTSPTAAGMISIGGTGVLAAAAAVVWTRRRRVSGSTG
ncbi:hypothetical protein AB0E69_26020 [Kribbella sp. NPDC026611]|uniref:hypothetical protein n=1 Tax=Kribbella sp. NPDC026611 TaxID=3154911 RepID=UPI0033D72280